MGKGKQIVHFKIFNRKLLSGYATYRSMEKGDELYEFGAVTKPEITENGVEAIVHGSRRYKCSIEWDAAGKDWDFDCTCPYDHGGICKHSIALGLWLIDNCEYAPEKETKNTASGIDKLINQADITFLRKFVKDSISADKIQLEKFKALLYDQETALDEISINNLVKEYLELLSSLEIPDEEEAIDSVYWGNHDYYVEEWEMIMEVQRREIEDQLENVFDDINDLIKTGKLLQAVYNYFALLEAFTNYQKADLNYEYEIIEMIESFFSNQQNSILKQLKKQSFRTETMDMMINTFFDRYLTGKSAMHYLNLFEDFMLCLSYNKDQAANVLKAIRKVSTTAADELQLKLVKISGNRTMKTNICQDLVSVNLEAAEFTLNKYKAEPKKYHDIVQKILPRFSSELLANVFPNLNYEIDPDLYRTAADKLFQMTGEIKYYLILKKSSPDFQFDHYLENFNHYDKRDRAFDIIIEEKQYDKAFQFFLAHKKHSYDSDQYLEKLVNFLPQPCFDHIIKTTSAKLASPGKREEYREAGKLLAVLLKFEDTTLRKKGRDYIDNLCQKYKNRPAMLDEFHSLKLI
ncbi:MAG: hypothetical protein K9M99_08470 [Candidatus Cloacimonetes bacterium]|nr:hypothetical protein [Candidatus Cloacimonadota bacterium]